MRIPVTRKCLFSVLLVGISIWLLCIEFHPFEPQYQGKSLSHWADILDMPLYGYDDEQMHEKAVSRHAEAENAVRHIGTRALPYAVKWCRATDFVWKAKSKDWLQDWLHDRLGKMKLFGVELNELYPMHFHLISACDLHERSRAIFGILGPDAKSEIPILIELLGDKDVGVASTAAEDLYEMRADAIAPLTSALTNRNAEVRRIAASLLELGSPAATSAVPALTLCLNDPDFKVRYTAASALRRLGTNAPANVVPAVLESLSKETNLINILSLVDVLERFGTNVQAAVPVLRRFIESQPTNMLSNPPQTLAMFALKRIDPEAAKQFIEKWKTSLTNWASTNAHGPARAASSSVQTDTPSRKGRYLKQTTEESKK
jgi:hypothetical protein